MPTYPLPTLGPTIDSNGVSSPTYADIYQSLIASFQDIYGADIYVAPDSQDGQWIAILARAIYDCNQASVAVFQSYSPTYAQGAGLSSVVKISGIARSTPTNSTALGTVTGVAGTAITSGVVQDADNNLWSLPPSVVIPLAGQIVVTVTAQNPGALTAITGSINKIYNPQLGWQSFVNTAPAVAGAALETDAELRQRQTLAVAQPSETVLGGLVGAIAALPGVTRYTAYENPTNIVDANGLPPHSISVVVEGGDSTEIATTICFRKTIGALTNGTVTVTVPDPYGIPRPISYYPVEEARIVVALTLHPISGYTSAIGDSIKQSVADAINVLGIGQTVILTRLYGPANLYGTPEGLTYEILTLAIAEFPGVPASSDVTINFRAAAHCNVSDITIAIV